MLIMIQIMRLSCMMAVGRRRRVGAVRTASGDGGGGGMAERDPAELLTVEQVAAEYGIRPITVWAYLRKHAVPRYRTGATGKRTLVKRGDWAAAYRAPYRVDRTPREATDAGDERDAGER